MNGRYVPTLLGRLPVDASARTTDSALQIMFRGSRTQAVTADMPKGGFIADPRSPGRLYVGTEAAGVFRSEDGGATWVPDSSGLGSLRIWSLVQHPITGVLYAGTEPAALYRKHPGATEWTPCTPFTTLPRYREWTSPNPPRHEPRVRGIGLDPERPQAIAAAIEEGWLVLSLDGGVTWTNLTEGSDFDSHSVLFAPGQPQVLLSTSGDGFYRSDDGGAHFRPSHTGLEGRYLSPLVLHPARPRTLYAYCTRNYPPSWFQPGAGAEGAFFRSDDQGGHWRRIGNTPLIPGGCWTACGDPREPETFCAGLTDGSVWLTRDGGKQVEPILEGLGLVSVVSI
ncbi:BNR/Asp-box repeat domain protein [Stigmatella aurantiaca DW4/3-1]|uniref:BNR/Asp-box repeat domain protein n=1 Tax=Stigmatella aurantiaca (strain DW4/3-1) TaxID=378806 RepID=E3FLZ6_STIAD|nr:BNR/Asp-box repeat domain protein [Stigmatella aurantiaca DW4/3-1]